MGYVVTCKHQQLMHPANLAVVALPTHAFLSLWVWMGACVRKRREFWLSDLALSLPAAD